ncbi:MAG: LegC family aminotransferase [Deltaproteobacteria bacterium]|nr:LegC family aminotransferase [Deltaproteobacteria bacterium]
MYLSNLEKAVDAIPLWRPEINGNEWRYVKECMDTGWVSSVGTFVARFEEAVAIHVGVKHAVALVNGTGALHLGLLAADVEQGDEVICPALTFIAPVNAVSYCGASPVFVDVRTDTLCIDERKVAQFLFTRCEKGLDGFTYNSATGKRIKALIAVHVFGHPSEMEPLSDICKAMNICLIEDATEALGSRYLERQAGALGDIGCFSFNGNKIITTGGGGMVVTDSKDIAARIRHLGNQAKKDPFEYDHDEVGYNYRLTNLQAAMGVAQMERLAEFVEKKRRNALLYEKSLAGIEDVEFLKERQGARSNCWFHTIRVEKDARRPLMEHLIKNRIEVRPVWKPIPTLDMYYGCETLDISEAIGVYETCVNLPSSVGLGTDEIYHVARSIRGFFRGI